jgi:FkbM family methyltransferase
MRDYSQHGEQAVILDYFANSTGTFLDIGANDGLTFSNTRALSDNGWSGVMVDASPRAYNDLCRNTKDRSGTKCIHAAITEHDGTVTLHDSTDTLVSSLDAEAQRTWAHHGFLWQPVEVPAMTVATLYTKAGTDTFDFVNIDAEGHDLAILRQLKMEPVKMLCIEYGQHKHEILAHCRGFRLLVDNGVNLILAR